MSSESAGPAVRHANSIACLQFVRDAATAVSVTEIAEHAGLSRPTVDAVMAELVHGPAVRESVLPSLPGTPGRPARRFRFNATGGYVAGIDAGQHSIRVLLADLAGTVVGHSSTAVHGPFDAESKLRLLEESVASTAVQASLSMQDLRAVCLGVPGILGHDDRILRSLAVPEWIDVDLAERLRRTWRCPVVVENDIKLAALAELYVGASPQVTNMAFFQFGHRVSVALIMDGLILQGSHRMAGELGSLRGMRWTRSSARGQLSWKTAPTAREVFDRVAAKDPESTAEVAEFCAEIAPKLGSILLTLDPDLVVIGGGLSRAGRHFLEPLRAAVDHVLMTPQKPDLVASRLTADGVVLGALGLAYERCSIEILGLAGVPPPWRAWRLGLSAPTSLQRHDNI